MMLNLSFINNLIKNRKLIIDYYNVYKINIPNTIIKNTKKKIETISNNIEEIFINNLDEEGIEDNDIKENTIYHYNKICINMIFNIFNTQIITTSKT